ncbi:MAG: restriction endonuclease subunit S [Campylobacterales bacterium]|nr:restriction endonuclease subunit S [Campylobacterales bacterium]
MRSNYNPIGKYIRLVDNRNSELKDIPLVGVSINKKFIPSVANTIGTNMKTYKFIKKNQFACSLMQVRRDGKIPVALFENEEAIISQAYPVFEITDTNELLPQYLMMWMSRSEFDREACFYAVGGVRGSLEWEDFCAMQLPVPSIEKQKEIIKEYHTIKDRIKLNEQLNQKLEDTTQSIYKEWFVDFEFPNTDGKPYKSNGGEMVFCDEFDGEIPFGWEFNKLDSYVKLSQGQVINAKTQHLIKKKGLPLLRITDLLNDTQKIFIDEIEVSEKNIAKKDDIIYSRTGQVGLVFRNKTGVVYNNCFKVIPIDNKINKDYLFWFLKEKSTYRIMVELASGSAQSDLAHTAFFSVYILLPIQNIQKKFSDTVTPVENLKEMFYEQSKLMIKFREILLSKMATID